MKRKKGGLRQNVTRMSENKVKTTERASCYRDSQGALVGRSVQECAGAKSDGGGRGGVSLFFWCWVCAQQGGEAGHLALLRGLTREAAR